MVAGGDPPRRRFLRAERLAQRGGSVVVLRNRVWRRVEHQQFGEFGIDDVLPRRKLPVRNDGRADLYRRKRFAAEVVIAEDGEERHADAAEGADAIPLRISGGRWA